MKHHRDITIGNRTLTLESGRLAKQADGACTFRMGDTIVLTTACADDRGDTGRDFLPLTVDYRENAAAGGRIPGGFFKREGRPTEKEIITDRQIDRPLRPLFPEGYTHETQIISFVLSADGENDPDVLAINGASAALTLSNIPFYTPIAAVRIGLIEGDVVFFPNNSERDVSDLDLIVVGSEEAIVMVEAVANQLPEEVILDCIFKGHDELQKIILAQHELFREMQYEKPEWKVSESYSKEHYDELRGRCHADFMAALNTVGKFERSAATKAVVSGYLESLAEDDTDKRAQAKKIFKTLEEECLRDAVLGDGRRFDGRSTTEVR